MARTTKNPKSLSDSGQGLLAAIEGYKGEHAGSSDHESIISQLDRVLSDIHKGSGSIQDSPGRREAAAASQGSERNLEAEKGHPGGDGQVKPNEPGPPARPHQPDEHPNIHGSQGRDDRLTGDVVFTRGNTISNDSARPSPGTTDIRRIAAERETSRPDSRFAAKESSPETNTRTASGEGYPPAGRVGDVKAPAVSGSHNADLRGAAKAADRKQPEPPPSRAGQDELGGDPFARAGAQALSRLKGKTKAR